QWFHGFCSVFSWFQKHVNKIFLALSVFVFIQAKLRCAPDWTRSLAVRECRDLIGSLVMLELRTPVALFFYLDEPQIDFIHSAYVLPKNIIIGVLHNVRLTVPVLQFLNHLVQFVHFRMHDSKIADKSDLLNIKGATIQILF